MPPLCRYSIEIKNEHECTFAKRPFATIESAVAFLLKTSRATPLQSQTKKGGTITFQNPAVVKKEISSTQVMSLHQRCFLEFQDVCVVMETILSYLAI